MQTFAGIAYVIFLFFAVLSPMLPLAVMWRAAAFSGVMLIAGHMLSPPSTMMENDGGLIAGLVGYLALAVGTLMLIRLFVAGVLGKLELSALVQRKRLCPLDEVILAVTGLVAGTVITYGLAALLGGSEGGLVLDFAIGILASAASVVLVKRKVNGRLPLAIVCIVLAIVAFVGSGQGGRIVDQADEIAAGRPWCLTFPATGKPVRSRSELGFFSLPKGNVAEHLGLRIGSDRLHWSIRQQSYLPGLRGTVSSQTTCQQRPDYADALRDGKLDQRG